MQAWLNDKERENIILITEPHGRVKWFLAGAGISFTPLDKMRRNGQADEEMIEKVRVFLKQKETKAFIAEMKKKQLASA